MTQDAAAPGMLGVDVSSFQGLPKGPGGWAAVAGPIAWGAVKISELEPGAVPYRNPDAGADWAYLGGKGLGRIAYLFGHPSTDVEETISLFLGTLLPLGLSWRDGIMLDLEVSDGLNPAMVSLWAKRVLRILQTELKRRPIVYTYPYFAEAGNCAGLGGYPLAISDPNHPAGQPTVPQPWTSWVIDQYSTGGAIDRDVAVWPTLDAMAAAIGAPPPVTASIPEDSMLMNRGKDAVTPMALPAGTKGVRLFSAADNAGAATVRVEFPFEPPKNAVEVVLSMDAGSHDVPVPPDRHAVRLVRMDSGADDVSVAAVS